MDARVMTKLAVIALYGAAAIALYGARTLGWGSADAPGGSRYKVSPVGLSHVLHPNQPVSPTVDCGWHAASGYSAACEIVPHADMAFCALKAVAPLLLVASALCGVGVLVLFPASHRVNWMHPLIASAAVVATLGAVALFAWSAPRALVELRGLSFGVGGSFGTLQVACAAALLAGLAAASLWYSTLSAHGRPALRLLAGCALIALPFAAFVMMFPAPGSLAFACASTGVGLLTGRLEAIGAQRAASAH